MRFRFVSHFLVGASLVMMIGCSGAEDRAGELYFTAQLEEKQFNPDHAKELYQEVIDRYPETSWAEKASEQIQALAGETR